MVVDQRDFLHFFQSRHRMDKWYQFGSGSGINLHHYGKNKDALQLICSRKISILDIIHIAVVFLKYI